MCSFPGDAFTGTPAARARSRSFGKKPSALVLIRQTRVGRVRFYATAFAEKR
jgi:hypothetical protein